VNIGGRIEIGVALKTFRITRALCIMTPEQTAMAKPIFTPSDGQKHVMEMQH
jgi:hypothetical protein